MAVRPTSLLKLCAMAIAVLVAARPGTAHAQNNTNPLKLIKGTISDAKTGKPVDGGKLNVYQGSSTETVSSSKINPKTGFFQLILSPNTQYRFEVVSPRFYTTDFPVTTSPGSNYEETVKDFKVEPIPMGTMLFSGRAFSAGSSTVEESAGLRGVVDAMKKQSAMVVTITVIPDLAQAKKAAPAPKKPKKGAAVAVSAPVVAAADPGATLGSARMNALKSYFKAQGISTTRIGWDIRPAVPAATKGKGADNVSVKITSIQDENDG